MGSWLNGISCGFGLGRSGKHEIEHKFRGRSEDAAGFAGQTMNPASVATSRLKSLKSSALARFFPSQGKKRESFGKQPQENAPIQHLDDEASSYDRPLKRTEGAAGRSKTKIESFSNPSCNTVRPHESTDNSKRGYPSMETNHQISSNIMGKKQELQKLHLEIVKMDYKIKNLLNEEDRLMSSRLSKSMNQQDFSSLHQKSPSSIHDPESFISFSYFDLSNSGEHSPRAYATHSPYPSSQTLPLDHFSISQTEDHGTAPSDLSPARSSDATPPLSRVSSASSISDENPPKTPDASSLLKGSDNENAAGEHPSRRPPRTKEWDAVRQKILRRNPAMTTAPVGESHLPSMSDYKKFSRINREM